jgi:hypothetical protein
MLEYFNNYWIILTCIILLYIIINKIMNLNKPFDEGKFIQKYKNQKKLEKNFTMSNFSKSLPSLLEYYVGVL